MMTQVVNDTHHEEYSVFPCYSVPPTNACFTSLSIIVCSALIQYSLQRVFNSSLTALNLGSSKLFKLLQIQYMYSYAYIYILYTHITLTFFVLCIFMCALLSLTSFYSASMLLYSLKVVVLVQLFFHKADNKMHPLPILVFQASTCFAAKNPPLLGASLISTLKSSFLM